MALGQPHRYWVPGHASRHGKLDLPFRAVFFKTLFEEK